MKIRQATLDDEPTLLALMQESHDRETDTSPEEWLKTKTAITTLLRDSQAGEAQLILGNDDEAIGYMIVCRGFSLDYGGYFTWVEEAYLQTSNQNRFRDQRFSP